MSLVTSCVAWWQKGKAIAAIIAPILQVLEAIYRITELYNRQKRTVDYVSAWVLRIPPTIWLQDTGTHVWAMIDGRNLSNATVTTLMDSVNDLFSWRGWNSISHRIWSPACIDDRGWLNKCINVWQHDHRLGLKTAICIHLKPTDEKLSFSHVKLHLSLRELVCS